MKEKMIIKKLQPGKKTAFCHKNKLPPMQSKKNTTTYPTTENSLVTNISTTESPGAAVPGPAAPVEN